MAVVTEKATKEFEERVVQVARVSRVVKGGKKLSFRCVVVIGNRKGKVGFGVGKAAEVSEAVRKAIEQARKKLVEITLINDTIPHRIEMKWKAISLFLGPAAPGTGVIAGGAVRTVLELAGIKNVLSKLKKSTNAVNSVYATVEALRSMRTAADISKLRSKNVVHPGTKAQEEANKIRLQKEEEARKAQKEQFGKKPVNNEFKKKSSGEIKKKDAKEKAKTPKPQDKKESKEKE